MSVELKVLVLAKVVWSPLNYVLLLCTVNLANPRRLLMILWAKGSLVALGQPVEPLFLLSVLARSALGILKCGACFPAIRFAHSSSPLAASTSPWPICNVPSHANILLLHSKSVPFSPIPSSQRRSLFLFLISGISEPFSLSWYLYENFWDKPQGREFHRDYQLQVACRLFAAQCMSNAVLPCFDSRDIKALG